MVLGSILNPVNSSMIAVSLIPIGLAFGAPPSETVWLVSGLYLATAVGQPVVGRLVDTFGPRRLYLAATTLVGLAGLLGALAPSLGVLVGARVLLGLGTCAGYPAAMSLLRSEARRTGQHSPGGVLTVLSIANQTTGVIGPSVGGLLVGLAGWRAIFAVNVPLSIACLVLGSLRLPREMPPPAADADTDAGTAEGLDVPGMALFAAMLTTLLLFVMAPSGARWFLPVLATACAVGLVVRELRVPDPFLDLRVLVGNAPLLRTYARQTLCYTATYAFMYGYTQWLEDSRGYSASQAGAVLLPTFGTAVVVSLLTGRHPELRGKLVAGSLALTATCLLLLVADAASPLGLLVVVGVLCGVTQGLVGLANQNALYLQADPSRMGSSAGLLRTFMYLGAIAASAAVAAAFPRRASSAGLHHLTVVMLACSVLLLLASLVDRSLGRARVAAAQA
nr:MFS transporter [Nocardioides panaciterrulae]